MAESPNETTDLGCIGHSSSQSGRSKKYARWKPTESRVFIAACETAIAEGHRHGKCFTKFGWDRVKTLFNSISGHDWSKQQLRNHWDAMRREHKRLSELLACTGVEYNQASGYIVALDEWWARKIKENKEYKEFKNKDVSDIYIRYQQLFGDSYEGDKYAMTPTKLCRTGLAFAEDSGNEDMRDTVPLDGEGSASSDEGQNPMGSSGNRTCTGRSGDMKRKSSGSGRKGKKKMSARELSFSVERATSAADAVAAKLHTMAAQSENAGAACIEELLDSGRLQRGTPLFFFACTLLAQKRYRDMLVVMRDTNEKVDWIEWQFNERKK